MKRPSPPPPPPKPLSVEHLLEQHHQPSTSTGLVGNVVAAPMSKNRSRSITTTASSSSTSLGVINPVFVSDLVEETNTVIPLPAGNRTTTSSQHPHNSPVHSAKSSISFDSSQGDSHHHHHHHHHQANNNQHRTVTTAAASSSSPSQHRTRSTEVKQPLGGAFDDDLNCDHCHRYHASHHLGSPTKVPEVCSRPINYQSGWSTAPFGQSSHLFAPPLVTTTTTPSPPPIFSPASYYLLGSDSRRHKHTHYHRNCRTCRQIVRETFERYYLQNNYTQYLPYQQTMVPMSSAGSGTTSRNSNGSAGSIDTNNNNTGGGGHYVSHNARASLLNNAARYAGRGRSVPMATTPPMVTLLPRRRANCGHSCLKYTILFYSSIAVILAICAICYLTRMFGYLSDQMVGFDQMVVAGESVAPPELATPTPPPPVFDSTSNSFNVTTDLRLMDRTGFDNNASLVAIAAPSTSSRAALFEVFSPEVVGVIIATALIIIFFLGLVGAFLESVLCLRIFGAILSYLFLLTFGAALYVIILMIISRVAGKLVLSTISCAAVAITMHAAIAIAPFAFADLLYQEKEDERNELNTYYKYPSVRFLPLGASKTALSYLPFMAATGAAAPPPPVATAAAQSHVPTFRLRNFGPAPTGHYKAGQHSPNNVNRAAAGSSSMPPQPPVLSSSSASSSGESSPNALGGRSRGQHHHSSRHSRPEPDSHSLEGLLPPSSSSHPGRHHYHHHHQREPQGPTTSHMVRFEDNWL